MTNVEARLRIKGKEFQVLVDVDKALKFKKEQGSIDGILAADDIFYDLKKGLKASASDIEKFFGTSDVKQAAEKIIKNGDIQVPSDYKKKELDNKIKQVIDFLSKNAIDSVTGKSIPETRVENAIKQAGIRVENKPIEQQISNIVSKLKEIMPIKIETKKLKITIPSVHTGKVYGLVSDYKEKEEWLGNGDLKIIINIPSGLEMDFYDKLNSVTHGSAIVEEVKK